ATEGFDPSARRGATGAADPVRAALAARLRAACEALGPTFVKFGQLLGSADGLLPPEIVAEFGGCRDDVAPLGFEIVRREAERALGRLDEHFATIDARPLAAASIAQVHAGVLHDGTEVVVKIQRPGVRAVVERDVAVLHALTATVERVDIATTANLSGMVALFAQTVLEELDFRLEAENMIEIALSLEEAGAVDVAVPHPLPWGVTPTVLVMERLHGRRLHDPEHGPGGTVDALALLRTGTQAVLECALTHGLFHGDMHAGNMLLLADGRYGLLDFGIVGRFDAGQRRALWEWITAMLTDDLAAQLAALDGLGAFPPGTDVEALAAGLDLALTALEDGDTGFEEVAVGFERIARILQAHGMRVPKELALFLKNLLHVNGAMRTLAPESDPYAEVGDIFGAVSDRCRTPTG
ncbi:MAG: phosphotransferase, partial [Acidimicrobiia bacterium]|nr:phosphotransferase [Acidimicrobiia bacterium]